MTFRATPNKYSPSATPFIVIMLQNPQTTCWSLKSHTKLKLTALFLAVLVVVQYFFSASIYDVRIFDYSLTQYYIWPFTSVPANSTTAPQTSLPSTTKEEIILSSTSYSPNESDKTNILKDISTSKIITKLKTTSTDTSTTTTSVNLTVAPPYLEPCPVVPPVLGKHTEKMNVCASFVYVNTTVTLRLCFTFLLLY